MKIVQKTYLVEEVEGKEIALVFESDTPVGALFDATMKFKGFCVDRMVKAHKEELEEAEKKMCEDQECEKPKED